MRLTGKSVKAWFVLNDGSKSEFEIEDFSYSGTWQPRTEEYLYEEPAGMQRSGRQPLTHLAFAADDDLRGLSRWRVACRSWMAVSSYVYEVRRGKSNKIDCEDCKAEMAALLLKNEPND